MVHEAGDGAGWDYAAEKEEWKGGPLREGKGKEARPGIAAILVALLALAIGLAGCSTGNVVVDMNGSNISAYENPAFGFSVEYPSFWNGSSPKLQDRWGIYDEKKNAILFIGTPNVYGNTLEDLGIAQMEQDLLPAMESKDKLRDLLRIIDVNNRSWYTYAIEYKDRAMESIVSGTLCGGNEVNIVMVSSNEDFNTTKDIYVGIMSSFACMNDGTGNAASGNNAGTNPA
jgi:hypothetical protein